jgi:hypothetical protein
MFNNQNLQDEWENILKEASVLVWENNEAAYLAKIYDGNPDPKNSKEAQTSPHFSKWWKAMRTEIRNMEHKQVFEITPKTSVPSGSKIIGSCWILVNWVIGIINNQPNKLT